MMKSIIKKSCIVLLLIFSVVFFISCEVSNLLISEDIRKSQPRDDIMWKNITIIPNTTDPSKVDATVLISARGVHIFYQVSENGEEKKVGSLTSPTIKNSVSGYGIFYSCYVPSNYNDTDKYIILTTRKPLLDKTVKYYLYNLAKPEDGLKELTQDFSISDATIGDYDAGWGIRKSEVKGSKNIFYKTKNNYYVLGRYSVGNLGTDAPSIKLPEPTTGNYFKGPDPDGGIDIAIDRIWESDNKNYAVVKYTKYKSDVKSYEKYATVDLTDSNNKPTLISKISDEDDNWHFDYFFVYDEMKDGNGKSTPIITWMGIRQDGRLYHSHSTHKDLRCDNNFSYSRYAPISKLDMTGADESGKYGLTLISRNSSNGFVMARFRTIPEGESVRVNDETITSGFAENLRSEDIAAFGFFKGAPADLGKQQALVVLSVEVGISTFLFDTAIPSQIKNNGIERRDDIALPFTTLITKTTPSPAP